MELLQLRYFVALAESENLTKTANALYISPSSLSLTISKLEREIGVKLFDRVGRKLKLNDNGQDFLVHLRAVLSELDFTVSRLQQKNSLSFLTESPNMWLSFLSTFAETHPDIRVNSRVARKKSILRDMLLGEYDFWLSGEKFSDPSGAFDSFSLAVPALFLAVSEDNPLAKRDVVTFADLTGEKFLFPFPNTSLGESYLNICAENNFEPDIVEHCSFLVRLKKVSDGEGISFADESIKESDLFKHIVFIPLEGTFPLPTRHVYWRSDRKLSKAAQEFLHALEHYYQEI